MTVNENGILSVTATDIRGVSSASLMIVKDVMNLTEAEKNQL